VGRAAGGFPKQLNSEPIPRSPNSIRTEQEEARRALGQYGFSSGPPLHFDVYRPLDGALRETIAVAFQTSAGVV
jgi:hypothetical protein